ncbi:hypothetical protein Sjap_004713 [Stephania japonica]|uniref:Potassium channel n=1 Tax=Stephania japonica TaxID=461633 RepID=A0AAP0K526_9MAGN
MASEKAKHSIEDKFCKGRLKNYLWNSLQGDTHAQEEVGRLEDGSEETVSSLPPYSSFRELSILFNIPQTYTVQVLELCRLLRIDKQSFMNVLRHILQ